MDSVRASAPDPASDILFQCTQCAGPLVVNAAAAGLTLTCQHCGQPTPVPATSSVPDAKAQPPDLERRLKENESQRTEVIGHINQLSIQIHRWKLRLQTLNERKAELEAERGSHKS
jgi:hypothetical protein